MVIELPLILFINFIVSLVLSFIRQHITGLKDRSPGGWFIIGFLWPSASLVFRFQRCLRGLPHRDSRGLPRPLRCERTGLDAFSFPVELCS